MSIAAVKVVTSGPVTPSMGVSSPQIASASVSTPNPVLISVSPTTLAGVNAAIFAEAARALAAEAVLNTTLINAKGAPYNAVGDGVTDDTAAVNAALAANLGNVYLPKGTYILNDVEFAFEGQALVGAGKYVTTIKAKTGAARVVGNNGLRGNSIRNLTIDGNSQASDGFYTAATAGATSQNIQAEHVRFKNCAIGYHIGNVGLTQADKNTLYCCEFVGCALDVQNDSVNGQETVLIQCDHVLTSNGAIAVKLNNGGCLSILGGQVQVPNPATTGTVAILTTGGNVGWVRVQDFVDEGVAVSFDGSGGWPAYGVEIVQWVMQGSTANILMGSGIGTGLARLKATQCRFNNGATAGGGIINCTAAAGANEVILEQCNTGVTAPSFTGNAVLLPGELPRAVGAGSNPAFAADFANAGGGYAGLVFYRDRGGLVHIEGRIKTTAGQAIGTTVFTLPAEYRPASGSIAIRVGWNDATAAAMRFDVTSAGLVILQSTMAAGASGTLAITFTPGV